MKIYKKNLGAILSKIEDLFIVQRYNDIYEINEVGARIFDLCDGKKEVNDIVKILEQYYKKEDLEVEIEGFIAELVSLNLISEA